MKIFVYGTLKRGERAAPMMMLTRYLGPAWLWGKLYNLGGFPGLHLKSEVDGNMVKGELYELPENSDQQRRVLERLDRYEGVPHLYTRRPATVYSGGEAHDAWTYEYNGEPEADAHIPSGDWFPVRVAP